MKKQLNAKRITIEGVEIAAFEVPENDIRQQIEIFKKGLPYVHLDRAATIGDGIIKLSHAEMRNFSEAHKKAAAEGRLMKFVPASGAATRMFQKLHRALSEGWQFDELVKLSEAGEPSANAALTFMKRLPDFAFYDEVSEEAIARGITEENLRNKPRVLFSFLLDKSGLRYAERPKALIHFHKYETGNRTAAEEHLVEALAYCADSSDAARVHFTLSPEHEEAFTKLLEKRRGSYEREGKKLIVSWSFQKPSTNTIAVTAENKPFLDKDNLPVFRPAGHGALLENVQELNGDIIFMKNIDNVAPDRLKGATIAYKTALCGMLISLKARSDEILEKLEQREYDEEFMLYAEEFAHSKLGISLPENLRNGSLESKAEFLFNRLNRPLRVCGMVENEGLAGGGPFWVRGADGSLSLQIIESSQIDPALPRQMEIFRTGTHFNPVDLVCAVRDYKGRQFELKEYRDVDAAFISIKSKDGRELKALELPGLWNGSMAFWNTVFVEVPKETFTPVKEVNDLLLPSHQ